MGPFLEFRRWMASAGLFSFPITGWAGPANRDSDPMAVGATIGSNDAIIIVAVTGRRRETHAGMSLLYAVPVFCKVRVGFRERAGPHGQTAFVTYENVFPGDHRVARTCLRRSR